MRLVVEVTGWSEDCPNHYLIFDLNEGEMYYVDHEGKEYGSYPSEEQFFISLEAELDIDGVGQAWIEED